jgi:hypothetical protein
MTDKEYLIWLYKRLCNTFKISSNMDYMNKLKCIIDNYPEYKISPNIIKNVDGGEQNEME